MFNFSFAPLIQEFHDLPRYDASFKRVSNNFTVLAAYYAHDHPSDGPSDDDLKSAVTRYGEGVAMPAGAFIAISVVLLIIFGITFVIGSCCRCSCTRKRGCCQNKIICSPRANSVGFILSYIFYLVACGYAISAIKVFPSHLLNAVVGIIDMYANVLTANKNIEATSSALGTSLDGLQTMATGTSLQSVVDAAVSAYDTLSSLLSTAFKYFTKFSDDVAFINRSAFKTSADSVSTATWVLLGIAIAWIALQSASLAKSRGAHCCFKFLSFFTLFWVFIIGILTSFFFLFGMVGSDACVGASNAIPAFITPEVNYYFNCTPGGLPANNSPEYLTQTAYVQTSNYLSTYVVPLRDEVYASGTAEMNTSVNTIYSQVESIVGNTSTISQLTTCEVFQNTFSPIWSVACQEKSAVVASINAFIALAIALFISIILLSFNATLIFHHPSSSDVDVDANVGDLYEQIARGYNNTPGIGKNGRPTKGAAPLINKKNETKEWR